MLKTVIGLMDNIGEAQAVVKGLVASGIRRDDIGLMANEKDTIPSSEHLNESEGSNAASGAVAGAGTAMDGLARLGVPEEEARYYAEGVRCGGILVTVAAHGAAQADLAAEVMKRLGAQAAG